MTDREYVVQSFARHFNKDKKIVLYGVGINTQAILEACYQHHILGLMDKKRTGQFFYGKKVLSVDEVAAQRPDAIVIVARIASCRLIYYRLRAFCRKQNIALYGINGKDLFQLFDVGRTSLGNMPYFFVNEASLRQAIIAHDNISFSVEDTLFLEKTWSHEDFLQILDKKKGDIVDCICKLLVPRQKMLELLNFAKLKEKKIYIVHQGGVTRQQIASVLRFWGVRGYDEIISPEKFVARKMRNHLHVGTECSINKLLVMNGSDVFTIKSAKELLKISSYRGIGEYLYNINDRSLAGCFIALVFNDPFILTNSDGRRTVAQAYELGKFFLGPMSVAALMWFIQKIRRKKYDGILFGSRDGYLMQKMYRTAINLLQYEDMPMDHYFQVSRILCWKATLQTKEDILRIWRELVAPSPELALQRIFELSSDEIKTYHAGDFGDEENYFLSYKDRLLEVADEVRENYQKYIAEFDLQEGQRYAFFDFVSRGACQHWLGKLLPCKLEGLYICRHHRYDDPGPESEKIESYFEEFQNYMPDTYLYAHYGDAEFVYTSPDPSIYSMDENGNPVYYEETRTKVQLTYVKDVQQGILDFLESYVDGLYLPDGGEINRDFADKLYSFISLDYTNEQCRVKDNLMRDDGLCMGRKLWSGDVQSTRR